MPNIPASFKKALKSEKGNLFTPVGRIFYANLFKPSSPDREDKSESKLQYGLTLLLPADSDLTAIEKEVDDLINGEFKPANSTMRNRIKTPLIETAGVQSLAALAEDYPFCIRLSQKAYDGNGQARQKPGVVDKNRNPVVEDDAADECYNGRWARCSVRAYPWKHKTGGNGVSLGLVNVQLLWHDEPLAGSKIKAQDEFEAVDIDDDEMAEAYE